jgi:5-dehydro-4-deoxyglucarate dehydratase
VSFQLAESAEAGPLFFPVTPFTQGGVVDLDELEQHIASRMDYRPAGVFVACGTGEFFSLGLDEYADVVRSVVEVVGGRVPVVAGVGYGAALGAEFLSRADSAGADAVLVFPPYATAADQRGLVAHYTSIAALSGLPVIVYQRDHVQLSTESASSLADIANIVGLKDGLGDLENVQRIKSTVGDRWIYFNGMPTAELSAPAFMGVGIPRYSSAVFAFLPEVALAFHRSLRNGDVAGRERLLRDFYVPLANLRDARQGYAVSLIKAGLRLRGGKPGSVRAPLVDPTPEHEVVLDGLIQRGLELVASDATA